MAPTNSRTRDALALTFASFFPLFMAILYFVVIRNADDSQMLGFAFGIGKAIQFLFPILYAWCYDRDQVGFQWPTWRGLPTAIGFALIVGIGMFVLYEFWLKEIPAVAAETPTKIHEKVIQFGANSPPKFLLLAFVISGVHSLAEEYYWRWFVFGWTRRHMPMALAIVLSSIGFMLHHIVILGVYFPSNFWTLALPFSVCVGVGGGVWAWIYARSGSLYAPWVSHCLIDSAIMFIGFLMLRQYWI